MAAKKTPADDTPTEGQDVAVFTPDNPVAVLTDAKAFDAWLVAIKGKLAEEPVDLSTAAGRKAIASRAYKVARSKTAIEAAAKTLTEEARSIISKVNEERDRISDELDALKAEVRKPLTDWEAAEEKRKDAVVDILDTLRSLPVVPVGETSGDVAGRLESLASLVLDPDVLQDHMQIAGNLQIQAEVALRGLYANLVQAEADRAELERLRAQQAERDAAAEAERLEREAEEARKREADEAREREEAEAERVRQEQEDARRREEEAAQAEAQRVKEAEERAAEEARQAAARKSEEEAAERQRAHEAELAEANRIREEAEARARETEATAKREREEREAADRKREEEAAEVRRQEEVRHADRAHRGAVMKAAKEAIMELCDLDEPKAKAIILAISGGNVPAVVINF